jgi:secondary thiamine-phosphate synthase enzyme
MKTSIRTDKKKQVIDITDEIQTLVDEKSIKDGLCVIFIKHTTAAVTTADLDPGTDQDYLDAFIEMIPALKYRHPHNPAHVGDHILSALVGTSLTVPVTSGQLDLGVWQRIIVLEFDGPRERELVVKFVEA